MQTKRALLKSPVDLRSDQLTKSVVKWLFKLTEMLTNFPAACNVNGLRFRVVKLEEEGFEDISDDGPLPAVDKSPLIPLDGDKGRCCSLVEIDELEVFRVYDEFIDTSEPTKIRSSSLKLRLWLTRSERHLAGTEEGKSELRNTSTGLLMNECWYKKGCLVLPCAKAARRTSRASLSWEGCDDAMSAISSKCSLGTLSISAINCFFSSRALATSRSFRRSFSKTDEQTMNFGSPNSDISSPRRNLFRSD